MSARLELPPRRLSTTVKVSIANCRLFVTVGFYDDEKRIPGELFMTLDHAGVKERTLVDALARMTSLAIQSGASLEVAMGQWLGLKGEVCGPVQGDPQIKFCTSALDYVARFVLLNFCGHTELGHGLPALPTPTDMAGDAHSVVSGQSDLREREDVTRLQQEEGQG